MFGPHRATTEPASKVATPCCVSFRPSRSAAYVMQDESRKLKQAQLKKERGPSTSLTGLHTDYREDKTTSSG